ncbi:MAG: DUF4293 family protein, partial [Bacteroidetes bacterium]|nr:DUF4293 family protein [Bacteroidota bacterium]
MIQRIQSVFLVIAVLINLATFFVPMWQFSSGAGTELITGLSVESAEILSEGSRSVSFSGHENSTKQLAHTSFLILAIISSLVLIFDIFQYNNRSRQITFAYVGIVLILLEILSFVLLTQQEPTFI